MALSTGVLLLGRYRIIGPLISEAGQGQLWGAKDEEEFVPPYLLKAWPFRHDRPDDVQRALWDSELKTLYRVRSTPGSEESLLQLHDVGIDHEQRCFVMVFKSEGLRTLASLLGEERSTQPWLSGRTAARRELWQLMGRIADGLSLLHEQQVVHRSVSPESVFLDPGKGPESGRLGGFEWSIRLGRPAVAEAAQVGWETAPEVLRGSTAFGPDADWFAFGMLVARCMLAVEHVANNDPPALARYHAVIGNLKRAGSKLTPLEHRFIGQLIAEDPTVRPRHRSEISATIREIVSALQQARVSSGTNARHILLIDPRSRTAVNAFMDRGLQDAMDLRPGETFDPQQPRHVTRLLGFLYQDFSEGGTLAPIAEREQYILSGKRIHLLIGPGQDLADASPSWQNARCQRVLEFATASATNQVNVPADSIEFFSTTDKAAQGNRLSSAPSWELILPKIDPAKERREDQERLCDFIRVTNQIDLLIRDAELFRCQVVEVREMDGVCEWIRVRQIARVHEPLPIFRPEGGMAGFVFREKANGGEGSNSIQLCRPDSERIADRPDDPKWTVNRVDIEDRSAVLTPIDELRDMPKIGDEHVLRTSGLGGQVLAIRRRKEAIARLSKHSYLLESLSTPGQVIMNSGPAKLPVPLDLSVVDKNKRGQIEKILGTRPIYTLQGPPGTGKTHMIAWLLREILEEDPVAQILVTAQAHPAVDVLRRRVEQEAFRDVPADRRPLAIRLRRARPDQSLAPTPDEGSEQQVTLSLLERTVRSLEDGMERLSEVQSEWLAACKGLLSELRTREGSAAKEFRELVKRSANITFSTAGDGDLAALSDYVSYDWAVVEEAGRAHGFELALPLCLGHRWLLIGDPKQLPPYRVEAYEKALVDLDATLGALEGLDGAGSLLDAELQQSWREKDDMQRKQFAVYCKAWLRLFDQLHKLCQFHEHEDGLLTGQHRMHPDIGELVSEVYYEGRLEHYTRDARTQRPDNRILHRLTAPQEVRDRAVVWLDVPMAINEPAAAEHSMPKFRNPAEAYALDRFLRSLRGDPDHSIDLAVLSPYTQQVGYLKDVLNSADFRASLKVHGIELAPDSRRAAAAAGSARRDGFFTVDSFQGNQAGIVAVSLVRNNGEVSGKGLGFLVEPERMNVMFSRAERLLILVGSWDFFHYQVEHVSRALAEESKLQHLAFAVDRLQQWFDGGRAVRVPADLSGFTGWHGATHGLGS